MIRREISLFLTAVSFYTRIPCRFHKQDDPAELLPDAIRYLPLTGWIAGLLTAGVYQGAQVLFGPAVAVLLSLTAGILLTGAFHEDGFADVCDGYGGGWTKEKILDIMKDSRLGTYGVTGLFLLLGLKLSALYTLLSGMAPDFFAVLLLLTVAHTLSRFAAIMVIYRYTYVRPAGSRSGAAAAGGRAVNLWIAACWMIIPLLAWCGYTGKPAGLLLLLPAALTAWGMGSWFRKWTGGYTGDGLGAVQQVTEVLIYLSALVLWKFS